MFGNKQEQTHTHTDPVCLISDPFWSHSQYMQTVVLLCGGCSCRGLHMLCFDVRHWFRSSCRLAAVRRWRWTGHRCIGIDRCLYKVVGLMTCLCRYKVLLLKPHLRDMLASARRRRAIWCYSMLFMDVSSWSDVWYLQVMSLENFTHAFAWNDWNVILLTKMRWAGCEGTFTFSKPPQSIAKRQGFWGFVGLEWWSQWGNLWQQLDLLSQSFCDKLKNVQPESCSHCRAWIKHVSRQCLAGTGFVSPDDLPPSDEEDDEEGQLVSVLFGSFWLTCMWCTCRHNPQPRPGMSALTRTWTSHADIHLKHMVHVVNCFDFCQTDLWRMRKKLRLLRSVIAHREKAVQFLCLCRLKTVSSATLTWEDVGCADYRRSTAMYVMLIRRRQLQTSLTCDVEHPVFFKAHSSSWLVASLKSQKSDANTTNSRSTQDLFERLG